ncbi:hypothetical protein SCHPADRAFT_344406 [Schizopora paradoxa]|uniref:Uncharacterized protein n=1 Tax=Schizopora paradoxa TaxID=27342 RepID=A0A0H2SAG0_9AGAM|nr:hypothetical protein SCHPADRAFT_344406 [Schizopora paradoxa]
MDVPSSPASEYTNYDEDANASFGPWASLIVDQVNNQLDHDFDDAQDVETILGQDVGFDKAGPGESGSSGVEKSSQPLVNPDTLSQILRIVTQQAIALDACRTELEAFRRESSESAHEKDGKIKALQREVKTMRKEGDKREQELARTKAQLATGVGNPKLDESLKTMERRFEQNMARVEGEKAELVLLISTMRIANAQLKNRLDERGGSMDVFNGLDEDQLSTRLAEIVKRSCLDLINECETLKKNLAEVNELARKFERQAASRQTELEESHRVINEQSELLTDSESRLYDAHAKVLELEMLSNSMKGDLETSNEELAILQERLVDYEDNSAKVQELQVTVEKLHSEGKARAEEFERSTAELRQNLADQEKELTAGRSESEERRRQLEESNQRVSSLEEESSAWKSKYEAATEANASLQLQVTETCKARDDALRSCDELKAQIAKVEEEASKASQEAKAQAQGQAAQFEKERSIATKTLEDVNEKLVSASSRFSDLESEHAKLQSKAQDLENSIETTKKELESTKSTLKETEKERNLALMNAEQLRAVLQDSSDRIQKLKSELETAKKNEGDLRKGRTEDAELIAGLRKELDSSNIALHKVEDDLKVEKKNSQDSFDRFEEVSKQLAQEKSTLAKSAKDLAEARKTCEDLRQADAARALLLDDLVKQVSQLKQSNDDKELQITQANQEKERLKGELADARRQAKQGVKESEQKIAEATQRSAQLEEENKELSEALRDSELQCRGAQAQLAEVQEHLNVSDRQNNELISSSNKVKTDLAKAQAHIEKLEAARHRMAAIYGLPTSQSPLPSPDRAHPMRRLSSTTHTPSASPPMPHSALSRVSPDQGLPPNKRARLSAATWPSTLNIDTLAANNISLSSMAAPRSAIEMSGEGRTADTAITIDDDTQASSSGDETEPSAREGATEGRDASFRPGKPGRQRDNRERKNAGDVTQDTGPGRITRASAKASKTRSSGSAGETN